MAVNATPKDPAADGYLDVAEADAYFAKRLWASAWTGATTADKEAAIKWATAILDRKSWKGTVTDSAGALRWPRSGVFDLDGDLLDGDTIPQFLKDATAELAIHLITKDRTTDTGTEGFSRIAIGSISLDVDKFDRPDELPPSVQDIIAPYLAGVSSTSVPVMRV